MDVLIFAVMLSQNSRRAAGSREVIAAVEGALAGDLLFRDFAEEMRTVTPSPAPHAILTLLETGLHNRERPLTWTFRAVLALLRGAVVSWLAFSLFAVAGGAFHWFSALGIWIETART